MSDSSWPHGLQPTRLLRPWDGKSTGVGCHRLLWLKLEYTKFILIRILCIAFTVFSSENNLKAIPYKLFFPIFLSFLVLSSMVGVLWYYVAWGTFKVPSHCWVWKGKFGKMYSPQCFLATVCNCWFLQNQVFCSGWGNSCFISEVQPQFCWANNKKSCSSYPGSLASGICCHNGLWMAT